MEDRTLRSPFDRLIAWTATKLGYVPRTELDAAWKAVGHAENRALAAERRHQSSLRDLREMNEKASLGRLRRMGDVRHDRDYRTGGRTASASYALKPPAFPL